MTPAASRPMVLGCFAVSSCFKLGRNRQVTDIIEENSSCSAVSTFLVNAACEFETGQSIKICEGLSPRNVKQRNRRRFNAEYQGIACFTRFETA
jgi:hypothetical protein